MSWVFFALIGQFMLGTSAVFDKMLLKKGYFKPLVFTFWMSVLGVVSLFLTPFGFVLPSAKIIAIAFASGVLFDVAMYLFFSALHKGDASGTLTITGGLSPIFTLTFSYLLLNSNITGADMLGFAILLVSGFLFFRIKERDNQLASFYLILGSAVVMDLSFVLSKIVFSDANFISGFVIIKVAGILPALLFLFYKPLRKDILATTQHKKIKHDVFYFLNRGYASVGSIFIYWAIAKTHPALVDASQSFKYVVIFFASWFLLRERHKGWLLAERIFATALVVVGFAWLGTIDYARNLPVDNNRKIEWGLTFSDEFSRELGLDWKMTFENIITDLKPKKIRLIAYWDNIEKSRGEYDFSDLDWQIQRATDNDIKIILAMGEKVPRWPECHIPGWASKLGAQERGQALRDYMQEVVERYRGEPAIFMWQVENEPFLAFGNCPVREAGFLDKEIELVKFFDPSRPILTTDGGEFGKWYEAAKQGDVFGATMYRKVYPNSIGPVTGVIQYPLSPSYFKFKNLVTHLLIGDTDKKFIIIELQGEPWFSKSVQETKYSDQIKTFSPNYFKSTIQYAKDTGFDEYYLWGAEWWYWMKVKFNDSRYWDIAKQLISAR